MNGRVKIIPLIEKWSNQVEIEMSIEEYEKLQEMGWQEQADYILDNFPETDLFEIVQVDWSVKEQQ